LPPSQLKLAKEIRLKRHPNTENIIYPISQSNGDSAYGDLTTEWVERANEIGQIKRGMADTAQALYHAAGKRNQSKKRKRE
jgi:hypothetical protein